MTAALLSMVGSGLVPSPTMDKRIAPCPGVKVSLRRALPDLAPRSRVFPPCGLGAALTLKESCVESRS